MAWFGITITDSAGNIKKGVRYDPLEDLAAYTAKARRLAMAAMKDTFKEMEVVILADDSPELNEHIVKRRAYYEALWAEQGKQTGKYWNKKTTRDPNDLQLFTDTK